MDIFSNEEEVLKSADRLISTGIFNTQESEDCYRELIGEYQQLLNQMRRMVKMSDLMESRLSRLSHELEELLTPIFSPNYITGVFLMNACKRNGNSP